MEGLGRIILAGIIMLAGAIYTVAILLRIESLHFGDLFSSQSPEYSDGLMIGNSSGKLSESRESSIFSRYTIIMILTTLATTTILIDVYILWWMGLSGLSRMSPAIYHVDSVLARILCVIGAVMLCVPWLLLLPLALGLVSIPMIRMLCHGRNARAKGSVWLYEKFLNRYADIR